MQEHRHLFSGIKAQRLGRIFTGEASLACFGPNATMAVRDRRFWCFPLVLEVKRVEKHVCGGKLRLQVLRHFPRLG